MKDETNPWIELGDEIKRRLWEPCKMPPFIFYFFAAIVIVGGIGVWIEVFTANWMSVPTALSTYLLALSATSAADLILIDESEDVSRTLALSLRMFAFLLLIAGVVLAIISLLINTNQVSARYWCSIAGVVIALLLYWIANADSRRFDRFPPPKEFIGGDAEEELKGSMEDIQT